MPGLLHSPADLAIAALAVALVGLSKGGLGGLTLLGVPILSMILPPFTAAALLLPILLAMDAISVVTWHRLADVRLLRRLLPASLLGIAVGWLTAEMVSDAAVRLILGLVSAAFVARALWQKLARRAPRPHGGAVGAACGAVAGYTSFVAHAGLPPLQIYLVPLGLDPGRFTATCVVFFAVTNLVKVIPYAAMGEFDLPLLETALVLSPVAVLSTLAGAWLVRRMRTDVFYALTHLSIAAVAAKLIHDGLRGL